MTITEHARQLLTAKGLTGNLSEITPNRWQLRGLKGSQGVAVEIEGQPDEAVIGEAIELIANELA